MTYDTLNPVPSLDPRDLDDNAQVFDRLMNSSNSQEPDRFGVPRFTWSYVEEAAQALVNPNVVGLASLTSGQYKVPMFNNSLGAMVTIDSGALGRTLFALPNTSAGMTAGRAALGAISATDNITGSAAKLTTARNIAATGDGTWSVSFDGSADVSGAFTLAASGVTANTYARVTVDAKGRVTAGSVTLPVTAGGTNAVNASGARTNLGAAASGANSDITSLTGLTTALSIAQGGTAATTAAAARTNLGAAASGANSDITGLSALVGTAFTAFTLQNSWVAIAGRRAAYRKYLGMLQIEMQIDSGTKTDGTLLATLPAGFRPPFTITVPVNSAPNATPSTTTAPPRVTIGADGTITCTNCNSAITFSAILALE